MNPCPFCGSRHVEVKRSLGARWFSYGHCCTCDAAGPHVNETAGMDGDDVWNKVIAAWNARHVA